MPLKTSPNFNPTTMEAEIEKSRVILFAPRLRNRNAFMSFFLQGGTNAYFYALTSFDVDLHTFLVNLVQAVQDFAPNFGRQTTQALSQPGSSPTDLADALLADLKKAKPAPRYLVLDEFDHLSDSPDIHRFFEGLIDGLSPDLQLVINSRQLLYSPWYDYVHSGIASVLGSSETLDGGILNPDMSPAPHLEVFGFGGGKVYVNGRPVDTWDGPLPRNLFYYFVDHPMVTRDEIFETFWADLPTKEATNVFHVTKRKISERLGYELTNYSGGFYRPSDQIHIHYDVARFEEAIKVGRQTQTPSPETWYAAIRLYRSQFLHTIEMPWISKRREELCLTYAEALIAVGRLYKGLGDSESAISYYLRALREVPQREDIHRDVMTLYEARGERDKAIAQYQLLSTTLKRTLNITPSKATRALYNMLLGESRN